MIKPNCNDFESMQKNRINLIDDQRHGNGINGIHVDSIESNKWDPLKCWRCKHDSKGVCCSDDCNVNDWEYCGLDVFPYTNLSHFGYRVFENYKNEKY